jgi:hypothetical protein
VLPEQFIGAINEVNLHAHILSNPTTVNCR